LLATLFCTMRFPSFGLSTFTAALASLSVVAGLGSSCSSPLGAGTAAAGDPYWLQSIKHQGISAFNSNPSSYQVFRNVKDFGAKGDGSTDDTAAINAALSSGGRCGEGCESQTTTPAVVYFPTGTYKISAPLVLYYYTHIIGDAKNRPTLLAAPGFGGMAMIDADPPSASGGWWVNQNNFFRSVRNIIFDTRQTPSGATTTGLHWQVSQATSLINLRFDMTEGSNHQGIWMENGSGGYMGDLVFNGGRYGMWVGNQQFTVKNVIINNAQTAVYMHWNWGWTFQSLQINNCKSGVEIQTGGLTEDTQTASGMAFIDAVVTNTPTFITTTKSSSSLAGSIVINNAKLNSVPVAVKVAGGATVLNGGTTTIASWGQGNTYKGTSSTGFAQGNIAAPTKDSSLLDGSGKVVMKVHPQYESYALSQIVSVRSEGAKGDGVTDDTAALKAIFAKYAGCKIIFFDAGTYVITSTLEIPAGTQMIGEVWSVIAAKGSAFGNAANPTVAVRAGASGSQGILEISDIIFSTIGPTPGAVVLEWNVKQPSGKQAGAGMWDSHVRIGGTAGTQLQLPDCPAGSQNSKCMAASLGIHITSGATAYFEGTWVWLADHELDIHGSQRLSIFSARGLLSESQGPVWLIGTGSEHHTLYQYNLHKAANHFLAQIQTESPYYQPAPVAPAPFSVNSNLGDPTSYPGGYSWGLTISQSKNIVVFGAGLYSFFNNYLQDCLKTFNCQSQILSIDSASTGVTVHSLSTVAVTNQVNAAVNQSANRNGFPSTVTVWSQ
jgi:glucan 1,3-beta-glucosidase